MRPPTSAAGKSQWAHAYVRADSSRVTRALGTIRSEGLAYYSNRYVNKWLCKAFMFQKSHQLIEQQTWRKINFRALNLVGNARLLLNPFDEGFSKEFNVYGFREPLNTFALFCHVAKKKPTILDIGGNLGYFAMVGLEAGAKRVVAVEPIINTFRLLSKTLSRCERAKFLNIAISDSVGELTLYVATERNVTSSSVMLLKCSGRVLQSEIRVDAETLENMVSKYSVNMLRMDVEGHEYRILGKKIPDEIDSINVELHVLPPYDRSRAIELVKGLTKQGFRVSVAVNEMSYGYYPLVAHMGLETAYKVSATLEKNKLGSPRIQMNPDFEDVVDRIPNLGCIHLLLER